MTDVVHRLRVIAPITLATVIVVAISLIAGGRPAAACSCEPRFPTVADEIGRFEIAFVGRLATSEMLESPEQGDFFGSYDLRYELIVEHAVKGVRTGDRVVMFGDTSGTSCGTSELSVSLEAYAILSSDFNGRFVADSTPPCTRPVTVDELFGVDLTLPETTPGPVSVVVIGRVGEAELIAYDALGNPVAYGDLARQAGPPAVCPGSERLVQLEQGRSGSVPTMTVRDTTTLQVIERVEVNVSTDARSSIANFLVAGATLDCRSQDGRDVVALLPWENASDMQTRIVRFQLENAAPVSNTSFGTASRARIDTEAGDVVAVADGAFFRYDTDGDPNGTIVAQLTDGPEETGFDAVFLDPDGRGGWWVGLGDGDYETATRLRVLVNVDRNGRVERWPITPFIDPVFAAAIDGDSLLAEFHSLSLPEPGSSADGVVLTADQLDDPSQFVSQFRLGDGRTVRPIGDENGASVELVGLDGAVTTLLHVLDVRAAVAVVDGPMTDPASIIRERPVERLSSPWILDGDTLPAELETTPSTTDADSSSAAAPDDQRTDGEPERLPGQNVDADTGSDGWPPSRWVFVAGVTLAAVAVVVFVVTSSRRPRLRPELERGDQNVS